MALGESLSFDVSTDARKSITQFEDLAQRLDALDAKVKGLNSETVNISVDGSEVDQIEQDVEQARRSLEQLEEPIRVPPVEIPDPGPGPANNVRNMRVEAEGLQRGIGPLRGFTDELGAAAGAGGVAANAFIDLGETVEIFGSQLGLSESTLSKLSLAIGGIGLAVGAGLTAWQSYKSGQQEAREEIERTTKSLLDQIPLIKEQTEALADAAADGTDPWKQLAAVIFEEFSDEEVARVKGGLAELGFTIGDLDEVLAKTSTSNAAGFFAEQLQAVGVSPDQARQIGELITQVKSFDSLALNADNGPLQALILDEELQPTIRALIDLRNAAGDLQIDDAISAALDAIAVSGENARAVVASVREELGAGANVVDVYEQVLIRLQGIEVAGENATQALIGGFSSAQVRGEQFGQAIDAVLGGVTEAADQATGAVDNLASGIGGLLDLMSSPLDEQVALLDIAEQLQTTAEARAEAGVRGSAAEIRALQSLSRQVERFVRETPGLNPSDALAVFTAINSGDLAAVRSALDDLTADRRIRISFDVDTPTVFDTSRGPITIAAPGTVTGNPAGTAPSGVDPNTLARVLEGLVGGVTGGGTTVNNYFGQPTTEQVAAAEREFAFRNGPRISVS